MSALLPWLPVALLAVLCLGMAIALVVDLRRDARRVDPLAGLAPLTRDQVARAEAIQLQREREAGRG